TGIHSIALARKGFNVVGIDRSKRMNFVAKEKSKSLPDAVRNRVRFVQSEYKNLEEVLPERFDAIMFMGAILAHNPNPEQLLKEFNKVLTKKAIAICQVANYEKVIKIKKRFYDFNIRKAHLSGEKEQAFLRFFDELEDGFLTQNVAVFARGEKRWGFRGMHSVSIYPLDKKKLEKLFREIKFSHFSIYGGEEGYYYDYLFRKPFKPDSDVLVLVARR
ncbi:MAG TPA: class I SAM-dependent methyltransferase, partial [Patescibacteria group bacterium]|nr:class I SAM-dependent methyltransferase [Patescibacteria group bacterium]